MLENKSGNISGTRKDRGKVAMDGLYKLTNALSNGTIPDPLRPPLPQNWGFATELPLLSQEQVQLRTSNLADTFTRPIRIRSQLKILEKMERGCIQGLPKFFGYPLLSQERVNATYFKFCRNIHRVDRNKSP